MISLCLVILRAIDQASGAKISCEKVEIETSWTLGNFLTCYMQKVTIINLPGTTIAGNINDRIQALTLAQNEKISYLPEQVNEKFSNLLVYGAQYCSLTSISRRNFLSLTYLRGLYLEGNQIKKISSETFDDLISLEILELGKIIEEQ